MVLIYGMVIAVNWLRPLINFHMWWTQTVNVFGDEGRIIILLNESRTSIKITDLRPEDRPEGPMILLEPELYKGEFETNLFYHHTMFFSYGSAGFYAFYEDPFKIRVFRNPGMDEEEKNKIDKSYSKYKEGEVEILDSISDMTVKEFSYYKRLKENAQSLGYSTY